MAKEPDTHLNSFHETKAQRAHGGKGFGEAAADHGDGMLLGIFFELGHPARHRQAPLLLLQSQPHSQGAGTAERKEGRSGEIAGHFFNVCS
jgi:hypothetical protein